MEFGLSGKSIKQSKNTGVKLPVITNKLPGVAVTRGQPETSPRASIRSAGRRPSGGIQRTPSANSETGEIQARSSSSRSIDEIPQQVSSKTSGKTPLKMQRAKCWTPEVENLFRYQAAGFRDQEEYASVYPTPDCWESTGFVKTLQAKQTGYYMYFRQERECEDRHLNKIKIYSYGER